MIFIPPFEFVCVGMQKKHSVSVQENLILNSLKGNPNKSISGFTPGNIYKLSRITPIKNKETRMIKYEYIFESKNNEVIKKVFDNSGEADEFIASVAGRLEAYRDVRQKINENYKKI